MKIIIALSLLLYSYTSYAQDPPDSASEKLFSKALEYYNNKNFDSAQAVWMRIVENKIGKGSYVYGNAFFNLGVLYAQRNQIDDAKAWFKKILASDLRDNDETGELMEPHTNYKHKSAMFLARLALIDSSYQEALDWVWQADTVYRYWGFEGSGTNVGKKQANLLNWKSGLLLDLGKKEEAIHTILSDLILSQDGGYFSESAELLTKLVDPGFKAELEKSLEKTKVRAIDADHWVASFVFQGRTYDITITTVYPPREKPHYWHLWFVRKGTVVDSKMVIDTIKANEYFQKL